MKLIAVINQVPPVVPTATSQLIKQHIEPHKPVTHYDIKDRVTISHQAKVKSRQITPVLIKDHTASILAYEIRRPYAVRNDFSPNDKS
jgi:hypothetical protein